MESNQAARARLPQQRDSGEHLFANERTVVRRVLLADGGGQVVVKAATGANATSRIDHETSILARLESVPGVPRLVPHADPGSLAMIDVGGRPLAALLADSSLSPARLLDLGVRLAHILGGVHAAGVIHRDLHPGNILIGADGAPQLIDFDLATTFAGVHPAFTHQSEILGRLPYLSPEQTGRTGLTVDLRSDLYGLGAVLFEAATGRPPFDAQDALGLVQQILTKVPDPLSRLAPDVGAGLAEVVAKLLQKEPDLRYQSAAGVAHDLSRLRSEPTATFPIGERDFPSRLTAPTQLVGRNAETSLLAGALDSAARPGTRGHDGAARESRALLVCGSAGVGKSVLIDLLRPMVTQRGGWFVAGKGDQVMRDSSTGLLSALRGLARLLLAEPSEVLTAHRTRISERLGTNAALITALVPEFVQVLGELPAPRHLDSIEAEDRTRRAIVDLLAAVASPDHPIVMFLDDLQWAVPGTLDLFDALLNDEALSGLLLVGAYRDKEIDAAHPLTAMLERWQRLGVSPATLRLSALAQDDLATLLVRVLRLPDERATSLASVIGERTGGNPFDTIELLNSLRSDGALLLSDDGWTWDADDVRHHIGRGDVVALLTARLDRLSPQTREVLSAMACLGNEVELTLLGQATGRDPAEVTRLLTEPLETGLLAPVQAESARTAEFADGQLAGVRFRHDRVQQAAHQRLNDDERRLLQLAMGRRLVAAGLDVPAAGQFLAAAPLDVEPGERELLIRLYRAAAEHERRSNNHTAAEQFLAAACRIARAGGTGDRDLIVLETDHHSTLYHLGRLAETDAVYDSVQARCTDPYDLVDAACTQIASLTNRQQGEAAVALGLSLLAQLGVPFPAEDEAPAVIGRQLAELAAWSRTLSSDDLRRDPMTDVRALAVAKLMNRMSAPAFFAVPLVSAWLVTESWRLWVEHGPGRDLIPALAHAAVACVAVLDDYRSGDVILRHLIALGEEQGLEVATSHARFLFTVSSMHWFEPIESGVAEARRAREGFTRAGDMQQAGWAFFPSVFGLLATASSLEEVLAESRAAVSLAERTGNLLALPCFAIVQQFCRSARGETSSVTSLSDATVDEREFEAVAQLVPIVAVYLHLARSLTAAFVGDTEGFAGSSATAYRAACGMPALVLRLVCATPYGVSLAQRLQGIPADDPLHAELIAELDSVLEWLRARAADQTDNAQFAVRFVEAERARALGDRTVAADTYDAALLAVQRVSRPWDHALLAKRVGEFYLERGREHTGRLHLGLARTVLAEWGATALVAELDRQHPSVRSSGVATRRRSGALSVSAGSASQALTSESIDMLAILRAAEALASQTSQGRLQATLVDQLKAISGATNVELVLRHHGSGRWQIRGDRSESGAAPDLEDPAAALLVPVSAVRYVLRTSRALTVDDAATDDRFARDPYLAAAERCALLVLPVVRSGEIRAVLVLENRLHRGAFTADRLDAVTMLTGQLTVALDNAQLYASLEERIADRTEALRAANAELERLSVTDALTGVANRRYFDDQLRSAWLQARRQARSVALIMIDIDHFKAYNDHFGHPAGDACLKAVSQALASNLRESDLICRYGGEEFAIIVPQADLEVASRVAERAREAVQHAAIRHVDTIGHVTVSVGVNALAAAADADVEELVDGADAALYDAKRAGRNRVALHRPDLPAAPDRRPIAPPG